MLGSKRVLGLGLRVECFGFYAFVASAVNLWQPRTTPGFLSESACRRSVHSFGFRLSAPPRLGFRV